MFIVVYNIYTSPAKQIIFKFLGGIGIWDVYTAASITSLLLVTILILVLAILLLAKPLLSLMLLLATPHCCP